MNFYLLRTSKATVVALAAILIIGSSALAHNGVEHSGTQHGGAQHGAENLPFNLKDSLSPYGSIGHPDSPAISNQQAYEAYLRSEYKELTLLQKAIQDKEISESNRNALSKIAQAGPTAAQTGVWSPVSNWPVYAIHMSLMSDGKVVAWEGSDNDVTLWNPSNNSFTPLPNPGNGHNVIFCASHTHLPNGNLFTTTGVIGVADPKVSLFNYNTKSWTSLGNLKYGRYYHSREYGAPSGIS
jgi:hypothetical protein